MAPWQEEDVDSGCGEGPGTPNSPPTARSQPAEGASNGQPVASSRRPRRLAALGASQAARPLTRAQEPLAYFTRMVLLQVERATARLPTSSLAVQQRNSQEASASTLPQRQLAAAATPPIS